MVSVNEARCKKWRVSEQFRCNSFVCSSTLDREMKKDCPNRDLARFRGKETEDPCRSGRVEKRRRQRSRYSPLFVVDVGENAPASQAKVSVNLLFSSFLPSMSSVSLTGAGWTRPSVEDSAESSTAVAEVASPVPWACSLAGA